MASYQHLPIYKQAMDVVVHFEKVVAGFSRYHKYTLGTELGTIIAAKSWGNHPLFSRREE